jgi:hypothetical protein
MIDTVSLNIGSGPRQSVAAPGNIEAHRAPVKRSNMKGSETNAPSTRASKKALGFRTVYSRSGVSS